MCSVIVFIVKGHSRSMSSTYMYMNLQVSRLAPPLSLPPSLSLLSLSLSVCVSPGTWGMCMLLSCLSRDFIGCFSISSGIL